MIRKFLLPIIIVLSVTIASYWIASAVDLEMLQAVSIAILVFCGLLTLYNYFQVNYQNKHKFSHMRELADLEQMFESRIRALEAKNGDAFSNAALEKRLYALENRSKEEPTFEKQAVTKKGSANENLVEENIIEETLAPDLTETSFDTASNPNVIPLGTATRRKQIEERRIASKEDENLPSGMSLEKHFRLFLHPIFEIPDREVSAISAVAGLYNAKSEKRHIFRKNGLSLSGRTSRSIVIKSVQATALAMHEMQKEDERVPVILDITSALVGSASTWEQVSNLLKNDAIFEDMFIAQVNMSDYLRFSKAQKERFASLRELEIELCIGNCAGYQDTIKLLESGQFHCATVSAAELMQYDKDRKQQLSDVLVDLANDHNIQVVATGLERESHIVALMDFEVSQAQGPMLSDPILSNVQLNSLEDISKDA